MALFEKKNASIIFEGSSAFPCNIFIFKSCEYSELAAHKIVIFDLLN